RPRLALVWVPRVLSYRHGGSATIVEYGGFSSAKIALSVVGSKSSDRLASLTLPPPPRGRGCRSPRRVPTPRLRLASRAVGRRTCRPPPLPSPAAPSPSPSRPRSPRTGS